MRSLCALAVVWPMACSTTRTVIQPPPDKVAAPLPADPDVVTLDADLDNRFVHVEGATMYARLKVSAGTIKRSERAPVNVALAIDTSGSMRGPAIAHARKAALALLDSLSSGDRLAVVVFHSRAEVLVPSTPLDDDSTAGVRDRIGRMQARGTTDLAGGLAQALHQVKAHRVSGAINRVVLLSDGVPNDARPIPDLALDAQRHGIPITALGLGLDYDETLLAKVAQTSGGRFHYIEEPAQVAAVFENEVLRMRRVVARGMVLKVAPGPGVTIVELLGHPAFRSGRQWGVNLGDLGEGETREVIAEVHAKPRRDGSVVEVLDVSLGFQDAVAGAGGLRREAFLVVTGTNDGQKIRDGANPSVKRSAARMRAAAVTVKAIELARTGRVPAGVQLLVSGEKAARRAAEALEDATLTQQADEMEKLRKALPTMAQPVGAHPGPKPPRSMPSATADEAPRTIRRVHHKAMKTLH